MRKTTKLFCRTVMRLNHVPRYGRVFDWDFDTNTLSKLYWTWQWNGEWGLDILGYLGLLWEYLEEVIDVTDVTEVVQVQL